MKSPGEIARSCEAIVLIETTEVLSAQKDLRHNWAPAGAENLTAGVAEMSATAINMNLWMCPKLEQDASPFAE